MRRNQLILIWLLTKTNTKYTNIYEYKKISLDMFVVFLVFTRQITMLMLCSTKSLTYILL